MSKPAPKSAPVPKINLYRNISISFVIFTVMLIVAIFFMFFDHAKIIVQAKNQAVNLSFNVEVKATTTPQELSEKDVVSGQIVATTKTGRADFGVLSTKTGSSDLVGQVKIVNNSSRNQPLVKTTQLQADNGTIVRTNQSVTVPAGGSVVVSVYPKDPANFMPIEPGNLTIIKLVKDLQAKIYGVVLAPLNSGPQEIKVLGEGDINRAKDELAAKLAEEVKTESDLSDQAGVAIEVTAYKTDKEVGEETDTFNLEATVKVKSLALDQDQLVALINRKIQNMNATGFSVAPIDSAQIKYAITDDNFGGNVLIKVEYPLTTKINADNQIFDKSQLAGKTLDEVQQYLAQNIAVESVQIFNSPYWKKTLPGQKNKIQIIVQ